MKVLALLVLGVSLGVCAHAQQAPPTVTVQIPSSADSVTFTTTPEGMWRFSDGAIQSVEFIPDRKSYPAASGETITVIPDGAHDMTLLWALDGMTQLVIEEHLSSDDQVLTEHATGHLSNHAPVNRTTVYQRVSGYTGFKGSWRAER